MDKSILRKFATESRKLLMTSVENQLKKYHIDEEFNKIPSGDLVILRNDKYTLSPMTKEESILRDKLVSRIKQITKEQVIEEAAYTWFNRIIAIRYMELHDMLPLTKDFQSLNIRVLSSKDGVHPEILKMNNLTNSALDLNIDLKEYSRISTENEQFNYVLKKVCNKLGKIIPQIFDGYTDYIDVLLPDNLLLNNGFVSKLIQELSEDFFNTVEVIGWLYQYYNQEEKDKVINAKKVYKKNEIPFATQLFTPDWIVKYMVENSLGRYWIERNYSELEMLSKKWEFLIKDNIEQINDRIKPTDITFIDPCSGSGHILVYAFEVFMQIYKSAGYNTKDIPELILKNNLYGLDIDDRAGQLSVLSVLLKAREYDQNIFNKEIIKHLNIISLQESKGIDTSYFDQDLITTANIDYLVDIFKDAKEIGSLLKVEKRDYSYALEKLGGNILDLNLLEQIKPLIKQAEILSNKYTIVVTNPPYMGEKYMTDLIKKYIRNHYYIGRSDLFSTFILKSFDYCIPNGNIGLISPYAWMFLDSYKELRKKIIESVTILSLIQLEFNAFEVAALPVCTYCFSNIKKDIYGSFIKLSDFTGPENQPIKTLEAINNPDVYYYYKSKTSSFNSIDGYPIAFWLSDNMRNVFSNSKKIGDYGVTKQGMTTADNKRFLRMWYEVSNKNIKFDATSLENASESGIKWFPYNKGGRYRKWYGNNEYIVNYQYDGKEVKEYTSHLPQGTGVRIKSREYYFKEAVTWTFISIDVGVRYSKPGFIFDVAGSSLFMEKDLLLYTLGFMCTKLMKIFNQILNPTMNVQTSNVSQLPLIVDETQKDEILKIVENCIDIEKEEWDEYETSWDFTRHPLLKYKQNLTSISESLIEYKRINLQEYNRLKDLENSLNNKFLNIYGLNDEIDYHVTDKEITYRKINKEDTVKSFVSYFVGCLFGRYSLDEDGLVFAGGQFDSSKYKTFKADEDNIIPITDTEYFKDDIVSKFKEFIKVTFGEQTLDENLNYVADMLGRKGNETSEQVIRRYFVNEFYKDHIQTYQKKPIYWLLDSGKKNGFKALIYMHRYDKNLISRVRLDYIGKVQTIYENRLKEIENDLNSVSNLSTYDVKQLEKEQNTLYEKLEEIKKYYVKLSTIGDKKIEIDLDNGVTENYKLFKYIDPETNEETNILGEDKTIVPKKK